MRDASGAVLPGVTVEASSPALIEKVRSVVTDGTGQYRIELLPPGDYTVTFTLPGFSTVRREGIQLTGTFTATIDTDLRVGAVEETITVTGETPIVDVQSATRQRVIDRELIDKLPTGRSPFAQMALHPGRHRGGEQSGRRRRDAALGRDHACRSTAPPAPRSCCMENGLSTAALVSPANSQITFNMAAAQEIAVDYSGAGADNNAAGVKMNVIPREGGNTFNGTLFLNGTTEALAGEQLLRASCRMPGCDRRTRFDKHVSTSIPASAARSGATGSGSTRRAGAPSPRGGRPTSSTTRTSTTRTSGPTSPISAGRCRTTRTSTTDGCA